MWLTVLWFAFYGLFADGIQAEVPVQLNVYYESMCPDSALFFQNQLEPTYKKLEDYMIINLIPYGNAHYRGNRDEYTFICQHGPEECYGNMMQTCFIHLMNNTEVSIQFINCAFTTHVQRDALAKCIKDTDRRRQVKKCVTGPLGNNLEYEMAKQTDALNPPHTFIPWVTVNGIGGTDINNKANENLMSVICDEITGQRPDVCIKNKWSAFKEFRNNYL